MKFEIGEIGTGQGRFLIDNDGTQYVFEGNYEATQHRKIMPQYISVSDKQILDHTIITAGERIHMFSLKGIKAVIGPAYTMAGEPIIGMHGVFAIFAKKES